ncbi:phage major capsid protein [Clostridium botulinum]|uniref:phage major capsid protein n=1 Tax=Clostridium botulinum TaxID=1491 RepID=UPI0006A401C8|nr:phage major capsid protein [Clostridium botulinum]KOC48357.1 hypothetical protein ADU88_08495 [Clostridium botulinum]
MFKIEYKSFDIKSFDDETGEFKAVASTTDVDLGNDIVTEQAMLKNNNKTIPLLWQHETHEPIGSVKLTKEGNKLIANGIVFKTIERGKQAYLSMKNNIVAFSIGYLTKNYEYEKEIRKLTDIDIKELSVVSFPMNENAKLLDIKEKGDVENMEMIKEINGLKERLKELEVKSQRPNFAAEIKSEEEEKIEKANLFGKYLVCKGVSFRNSTYIKEEFKNYPALEEMESKSLMSTETATNIVPKPISTEIVNKAYEESFLNKFGVNKISMTSRTLDVPTVLDGTQSAFVKEGARITKTNLTFGTKQLDMKYLACIVPVTNQALQYGTNLEQIIQEDVINSQSQAIDYNALYGDGKNANPKGIVNAEGIIDIDNSSKEFNPDMLTKPLKEIRKNLKGSKSNLGWVINSDAWETLYNFKDSTGNYMFRNELNDGKLLGIQYAIRDDIKTEKNVTDIFLGNWSDFCFGYNDSMKVDLSDSIQITPVGESQMCSAAECNSTAIRVISECDFILRKPNVFSRMKVKLS